MHRFSTHAIAFSLGVLALGALTQGTVPPTPAWVSALCADASPCVAFPTSTHQGIAFAEQWLETDGTPCPTPAPGQHPQSACTTSPPNIAHWLVLTRGGPAHLPLQAIDHDVFVATDSPIYSTDHPIVLPNNYALGLVMSFGVPADAVASPPPPPTPGPGQAPALPVLDAAAWSAWADAWCATNPTCSAAGGGGGGLTAAEFATLCAADPQCSQDDNHVHDLDPAQITVGGSTVTTTAGR